MRSSPAPDQSPAPRVPRPRQPRGVLLGASVIALLAWITFLTLVALRVV